MALNTAGSGALRDTSWMDADNDFDGLLAQQSDAAGRRAVPPALRLMRLRQSLNEAAFTHRPGRTRRVVSFVRAPLDADVAPIFDELDAEAGRRGWTVSRRIRDTSDEAPQKSPGWLETRKVIYEGFADGVVTPSRDHISADDEKYEHEVRFVCERPGFVVLLMPEAAT